MRKPVPGNVYEIDINGLKAYALSIENDYFCFFKYLGATIPDLNKIVDLEKTFVVSVVFNKYFKDHWELLGCIDEVIATDYLMRYWVRDPISGKYFEQYNNGRKEISEEEAMNIEPMAVWMPQHIESRIYDDYHGNKNVWLNALLDKH